MCLYPRLIKNRKYTANKKNGGIIPAVSDKRTMAIPVGCGKCIECCKQKSRDWQVRLLEDIRHQPNAKFITLTFSTESIKEITAKLPNYKGYELDNEIAIKAMRLFTERWRKKFKKAPRHWFVTELGGGTQEHMHMHGILYTNEKTETIEKIWNYGYIFEGSYVNEETINYIVKYIYKQDEKHKEYKPIILASKGIGKGYLDRLDSKLNKFNGEKTRETYTTRQGFKLALPKYYRNKIYSDEEREKLWIQLLDKNTRYVLKQKIDISKGEQNYWNAMKEARELNSRLGYGDNRKNWEREKYENERRELLHNKRIEKEEKKEIEAWEKVKVEWNELKNLW